MSDYPPMLDDTMSFTLRASKVVINKTVKITVQIVALSPDDSAESQLRADIKAALAAFIPDADWQISGIQRNTDDSGYERVNLIATARVDEKENYNLESRAKKVSKTGLQLISVDADTTVPQADLEAAERELRAAILADALAEAKTVSEATGLGYRIKKIDYQNGGDPAMRKMVASTSNITAYGSGFGGDDEEGLSNAQKVTLSAQIQLAHASLLYN
jgi:hypothetical protein